MLGVAAQRAITEMRRRVEAHVARLPVSYFDSTQSGVLISRIMTDAEGIRNLVGTGLVQLTGSVVTALAALAYLFYLNWWLPRYLLALMAFGGARGARVQAAAPSLPSGRAKSPPSHRAAERNARRQYPHREDLYGGEAESSSSEGSTGCFETSHSRLPAYPQSRAFSTVVVA